MAKQIKSKERVAKHGEVFTAEREVNAMLDLVDFDSRNMDSRFLEPACGEGNFLAEVLRRKITTAKEKYKSNKCKLSFEKNMVIIAGSVYGIDILIDNVETCRERMFKIWDKEYKAICKKDCNEETRESVRFIFKKNIVLGNALTLMCVDENGIETEEPIVFSEWSFVTGSMMQRNDYTFDELVNAEEHKRKNNDEQMSMFDTQDTPDEEGHFLKRYVSHYKTLSCEEEN